MAHLPHGVTAKDLGRGQFEITVCPGQIVPAEIVNGALAEIQRIENALRAGAERQRNEPKGGR